MLPSENTIYIIQYDYDLNSQEITIPANCVLDFNGGSLSNGTIVGNNTEIISTKSGIFNNVYFSGTYNITHIYDYWFLDNNKDLLQRLFALTSDNLYNVVHIEKDHIIEIDQNRNGVIVNSNTDIHINSTIQIAPNNFEWYQIIQIMNKSNVSIKGTGSIIGDSINHLGTTGESGHGINIEHSENIDIIGITVSYCWGDGIYIGGNRSEIFSKNININNVEIHHCRRQGISITHCDGFTFSNLNIYDIYGTAPQAALDIEPNENKKVINGIISNSSLIGTQGVLLLNLFQGTNNINNIQFINCYISTSNNEDNTHVVHISQVDENIKFIGCTIFNVNIQKTIYITDGKNKVEFYECNIGNNELVDRAFMLGGGSIIKRCNVYTGIYVAANDTYDIKTYITNSIFYNKKNTISNTVITDCIVFGGLDASNSNLENNEIKGSEYLNAESFYPDCKLVLRTGCVAKNNIINYDGDTHLTAGVVLYNNIVLIENEINIDASIVLYSMSIHVTDIVIDNVMDVSVYIAGDFAFFRSKALIQGNSRPALTTRDVGFQFFDISVTPNKPIWWTGSAWVDATGTEV